MSGHNEFMSVLTKVFRDKDQLRKVLLFGAAEVIFQRRLQVCKWLLFRRKYAHLKRRVLNSVTTTFLLPWMSPFSGHQTYLIGFGNDLTSQNASISSPTAAMTVVLGLTHNGGSELYIEVIQLHRLFIMNIFPTNVSYI